MFRASLKELKHSSPKCPTPKRSHSFRSILRCAKRCRKVTPNNVLQAPRFWRAPEHGRYPLLAADSLSSLAPGELVNRRRDGLDRRVYVLFRVRDRNEPCFELRRRWIHAALQQAVEDPGVDGRIG
jgi:hypothetical protein